MEDLLDAARLVSEALPGDRGVPLVVRRHDLDPGERLELLAQNLIEQQPLLLLLDNFEDNLAPLEALEYLDALLRGGKARFEDVAVRIEKALEKKGVADPRAWLAARGGDFDVALAETVTLAADDVLLEGLLERLRLVPLAERLLLGAAVYRVAVEETALVWQVGDVPGLPRDPEPDPMPEVAAPAGFAQARAVLEELGLLAPVELAEGGRRFAVHRWTASRLAERAASEELEDTHRRAARYWRWHYAKAPQSREQDMLDLLEARHHHHQAGELAEATLVTEWVCSQLETWGAYRREEQLIHELLGWLPERSEKAAASYHHLGIIAQNRGDYDQALDGYRKSLLIKEELGNRAGMAKSYSNIGALFTERGEPAEAIPLNLRGLAIHLELGSPGVRINLHWLRRQREQLGDERFRAILSEHLDADSLAAVWEMIENVPGDARG